ncbi:MAG: N-6 DNA methylase [Candidatus Thiodiazotropha sp. (ex Lucinoma borealis)]|nr:N-6 DNA methylase [Candidatus Thiodiazotropha sp. (ex Lucinoma borealis)]
MNKKNDSIYTAIRIEGGLLSTSLLDTLRHYGLPGQGPADYGIEKGLKLADELGRYWRIAQARWEQFTDLRARSDIDRSKLAVEDWLLPLFTRVLGFEIEESTSPASICERLFPVTHTACNGVVPLVLTRDDQALDKGDPHYGQEGRKRSPMGLAQEYLNAEDNCLWAMVSNGLTLRLLRDNPAMTRPAYVEVDLERIFSEELYVDFTVFWLLFHSSRFIPRDATPNSCYMEQWRDQGQTDGERVLGQLRYGVTDALRLLGTGFVCHPGNKALRATIQSGELTTNRFFQELLRLIYRFLFLLTTEDRDILLDPDAAVDVRNLYRDGYSISNLRDRARLRRYWDRHEDAWQQLLISFSGFAAGQPRLGQPALGGLFATDQCPALEQALLANRYLFNALFKLCYFESDHVLVRINYRDMDTEELGSVYESLLELIPQLNVEGQWRFGFMGDEDVEGSTSGHARKLTGSYYTPDALVQELIQSALVPVIGQRLQANQANPREALLKITVCDPACGSGHFLLAAARRLAAELARIEAGADQPSEADYRHALRQVVRHCIYGVDMNPLAVELCRTALWLEAIEPGKPLGFLDAHILVGNSLVGVHDPKLLEKGIPDAAFKPLTGNNKTVVSALKKRNKLNPNQKDLFASHNIQVDVCAAEVTKMPEESLEQIEKKREVWLELTQSAVCQNERLKADLFTAAFFAPKIFENAERVPTNVELAALESGEAISVGMREHITKLAERNRFFHWFLAFPEVFEEANGLRGGFDVVLGNPPWDVSQFSEEEFFSPILPELAKLKGARRRAKIEQLKNENPALWKRYSAAKGDVESINNSMRSCGRFRLSAKGKLNLYALFTELAYELLNREGFSGLVVQSGLATDNSTKDLFFYFLSNGVLKSFFEFVNEGFFLGAGQGHMVRFALVTLGNSKDNNPATFVFQAKEINELRNVERKLTLTLDAISLINPNTKNCPIFRSKKDLFVTEKIYKKAGVLLLEGIGAAGNPWSAAFSQGLFNSSSDSHLFLEKKEVLDEGATIDGNTMLFEDVCFYPLYEAKMAYIYNHRHGDFDDVERKKRPHKLPSIPKQRLCNSGYCVQPYYWVNKENVVEKIPNNWRHKWFLGWRDVTDARASVRTTIACIIPMSAVSDTFLLMYPGEEIRVPYMVCLYANLCSLTLDYAARQKVGGLHMKYNVMKQLPILPPSIYAQADLDYIVPRVLELTYTSYDLKPFAEDLGYDGEPFPFDPERRHQIKCELDAYYAKLYGLSRDELRYILDPADVMGEDYPSETFRVLKKKEIKEFKAYRTRNVVVREFDRLNLAVGSGQAYQSLLNPQPGVVLQPTYSPIGVIRHDNDARLAGFILVLIKTEQNLSRSQLSLAIGLVQHPESAKLNSSDDELSQLERFSQPFTGTGNTDSFDRVQQFLSYLESEKAIRVVDQGNGFKYVDDDRVSAAIHITSEIEAVARVVLDILARKQAAETEEGRQDAVEKIPPKQA